MSEVVIKCLPILELLSQVNKTSRIKILKGANLALIKAIVECVFNVLEGNVELKALELRKLKKYKNELREISKPGRNYTLKKKVIIQSGGGFLPTLLIPIVTSLIINSLT